MKKLVMFVVAIVALAVSQTQAAGVGHAYYYQGAMRCGPDGLGCSTDNWGNPVLADQTGAPQSVNAFVIGRFTYPANHVQTDAFFNATIHFSASTQLALQKACFGLSLGFTKDNLTNTMNAAQDLSGAGPGGPSVPSFHGFTNPDPNLGLATVSWTPAGPVPGAYKTSATTSAPAVGFDMVSAIACTGLSCIGQPGWMGITRLSSTSGFCASGTQVNTSIEMIDVFWNTL